MKTRLPYLSSHLRNLNRSVKAERKRFFKLYPIALLVCGFGFGWCAHKEREYLKAVNASANPIAIRTDWVKFNE